MDNVMARFDPAKLDSVEFFWRDHQQWLEKCGYMLRSRYLPGWKASWLADSNQIYFLCEDGQIPTVCPSNSLILTHLTSCHQLAMTMMDATRITDGKRVMLKLITHSVHPYEADIATYLTAHSDPKNHCVPTYEVLKVPDIEDKLILVMPLLRRYNNPKFETVGECIDYFQQVFEVCVHAQGIQFPSFSPNSRACSLCTVIEWYTGS